MEIYKYPQREQWNDIFRRPSAQPSEVETVVRKIIKKVRSDGDKAIRKYAKEFHQLKLKKLEVTESEKASAADEISKELRTAIEQASKNIETFHLTQRTEVIKVQILPGITCWRKSVPIDRIGFYIPGGSAPLFSTVLMLGIPARLAGCKEIVICSPPDKESKVNPAILFAAAACGISKIFKAGGAQAIAAMTYGTETIPRVSKIFGPGNQYVTAAKQYVQQEGMAIDLPAGPSELLIIADETANPRFVAADLLSQAEHGADSQVILITTNESLAEKVVIELADQLEKLPRKDIAHAALQNSRLILVKSIEEAVDFSNSYAPEHLELACENSESVAEVITAAGSVFLGNYSPESAGDYASGTNHVLPTNGFAAQYSGVSLDSFVKKITYQQLTKEGLAQIADTVMTMAENEKLDAHRRSIAIRINA